MFNLVKWGFELKMNRLNWSIPISSGFQFHFNSNSKSFNSIPIQFMLNWIELIINFNSIHELIRALYIISYHIISYHIISYIISYHIIYPIPSCHAMPCHALSCHAMPCDAMPCHAILCHIIYYHIISYHIISYHILSYLISYHIISYIISYHIIFNIIGPNLRSKVTTSMSTGLMSRLLWVLAMPNNNVIRHWYSSNVEISKLRWILVRLYCLRRVPQKLLVICGSINEYWQCFSISSEVQHPDSNHYMEFFMGVQTTKLGIIPHPTLKGIM